MNTISSPKVLTISPKTPRREYYVYTTLVLQMRNENKISLVRITLPGSEQAAIERLNTVDISRAIEPAAAIQCKRGQLHQMRPKVNSKYISFTLQMHNYILPNCAPLLCHVQSRFNQGSIKDAPPSSNTTMYDRSWSNAAKHDYMSPLPHI